MSAPQTSPQLLPLVARIERLASQWLAGRLSDCGLSHAEFRLLGILHDDTEGKTQKDLAFGLGLDASGVSVALKRLEEKGYVVRRRDPKDARLVRVRLANAHVADIKGIVSELEKIATADLDPEDRARLQRTLVEIARNLSRACHDLQAGIE